MKNLIGLIAGGLFFIGFLGSFWFESLPYRAWTIGLVISSSLIAIWLGAYWHSVLGGRYIDSGLAHDESVSDLLNRELKWLQGVRPKIKIIDHKNVSHLSIVVRRNYASSFVFALILLSLGVLLLIAHDSNASRGVFGALLTTSLGRGVATVFLLYLFISSVAVFCVGVLAFLRNGRVK